MSIKGSIFIHRMATLRIKPALSPSRTSRGGTLMSCRRVYAIMSALTNGFRVGERRACSSWYLDIGVTYCGNGNGGMQPDK